MTPYQEKASSLKHRVTALSDDLPVDETAVRLELMNWAPELLVSMKDFHRITKDVLMREVVDVLSLNDNETAAGIGSLNLSPERARLTQASLLVNAAELLWKLRSDIPEAWDHVNELYEDD